jgi:glycosyltransferase involved in cell wall biosynthesis
MSKYSIVIATRNRPAALKLSIPRMLNQSRPPAQLLVVDSSDDHAATVKVVLEAVGSHPVDLSIFPCERGLTRQRNASLPLIKHSLVFFPDDDSIWFPAVASAQLDVYERDLDCQIAAVCGAEEMTPPLDWQLASSGSYQMRRSHRLQQRVARLRAKVEDRFFPDPAKILGRSFYPPASALPKWFAELDVVPVEWMTGFRMSFRTEVIRKVKFDEAFARYSLFEDIDASFGAWRHGWVVGARKARIYHYRSPERRDHGMRLGFEQVINKAYLVAKHAPPGHPAHLAVAKFAHYKAMQYRIGRSGEFGKQRHAGAQAALKELAQLAHALPSELPRTYQGATERCLEG